MSPCWTVTTVSLNLEVADLDMLKRAIEQELGVGVAQRGETLSFYYNGAPTTIAKGQISTYEAQAEGTAKAVKKAYSSQAVKEVAQKFRWQAKKTAVNKFEVVRRY